MSTDPHSGDPLRPREPAPGDVGSRFKINPSSWGYVPPLSYPTPAERAQEAARRQAAREAAQSGVPVKYPLHVPKEIPPHSWARQWGTLSQELSRRTRYERSGHWLDVWAQLKDGSSLQGGHYVEKWAEKAAELCSKGCSLGLVAMRQTSASHEGSPGVTFVLTGPSGGAPVARQLMSIFARHGLGGALADSEANGRWAIVKYLYSPHWYVLSGDRTFGVDWSIYDHADADHNEGKRRWCAGVEAAIRQTLSEFPSPVIDSLFFDSYQLKDTLERLTPAQRLTLRKTPHAKLGALLSQSAIPEAGFWARLWG